MNGSPPMNGMRGGSLQDLSPLYIVDCSISRPDFGGQQPLGLQCGSLSNPCLVPIVGPYTKNSIVRKGEEFWSRGVLGGHVKR